MLPRQVTTIQNLGMVAQQAQLELPKHRELLMAWQDEERQLRQLRISHRIEEITFETYLETGRKQLFKVDRAARLAKMYTDYILAYNSVVERISAVFNEDGMATAERNSAVQVLVDELVAKHNEAKQAQQRLIRVFKGKIVL